MKKILILTGELSGEIHAANLIKELKKKYNNIKYYAVGSKLLKKNKCEIIEDYKHISIIGFSEVISKFFIIRKIFKKIFNFIKQTQPDLIITIDFPGFNLRVAKYAKNFNIKTIYFIPPQIWAWNYKRIKLIKKYYSLVFPILPFEKKIYAKENIPVRYYGHPIIDNIKTNYSAKIFKQKYNIPLNKKIIIIMPGSRQQEIKNNLKIIIESIKLLNKKSKDLYFIISAAKKINLTSKIKNLKIIYNRNYDILNIADAGIIKSGTSTIEAAFFKLPFVVVYKVSRFSYLLIKYFLVKVKFVSLVNLIANKKIVKELLQDEFTPENISDEILKILKNKKYRNKMIKELSIVKKQIGRKGVLSRIAKDIIEILLKG